MKFFGLVVIAGVSTMCGTEHVNRRGERITPSRHNADQQEAGIVRGRWEIKLGNPAPNLTTNDQLMLNQSAQQAMSATVAAAVRFDIDNSNYAEPASPSEGDVSFGSIDVSDLFDNQLDVCGAGGNAQCSTASVRVYTKDTAGPGLWNAQAGYGLPIATSGNTIGLNVLGAYTVGSVNVSAMRILRLRDFSPSGALAIPLSVNFDNAGAGTYSTTLVIEYTLQ
jgi:hypothetical protein